MLNLCTSRLENTFICLTNFKVLLRHLNLSLNIYSQNIFKDDTNDFRYVVGQIKRSTKRLIDNLKITKIKSTPKTFFMSICREYLDEFSPFKRVFILKKYFKLARFET